ncbi:MAG: methionine--tRNA ligase [Patescibacteria group bacterium]|nr:methionine--tRNA ligase [Patescibacteria group bacterium]
MKNKFYITTSIAYTNAAPHIGYALELIQADFLARLQRSGGQNVLFLTGTDEHGLKIARSAASQNKTPQAFVDSLSRKFKGLKKVLDLSFDDFIRTSDKKRHIPGAIALWKKLEAKGDLYPHNYKGMYCAGCEAFIKEKDLVDGLCPIHKRAPEEVEERNWFFRLSRYSSELQALLKSGELQIYPESRRNEMLALIKSGLEDVSFSRPKDKVGWGIPVPGDSTQTMYVWCDALSNYISAIGYGQDEIEFRKWWPADVHLVGKDIIRFHALIWPAMLLSAGLHLPKKIFVHGFINVEGEKMSKSLGNVVDPYELAEKYGSDAVRYYFLREIPSDEDGDFGYGKLEDRYNGDLANGFGNFASRVTTLAARLDKISIKEFELDQVLTQKIVETEKNIAYYAERFKLHEATRCIWDLVKEGDVYLNSSRPWELKEDDPRFLKIILNLIALLEKTSELAALIIPRAALKVKAAIKHSESGVIRVKKLSPIFPKINE